MYLSGERWETDTNRYDAEHATADHPRMTSAEWEDIYGALAPFLQRPRTIDANQTGRRSWYAHQTDHINGVLLSASHFYEHVHPLQGGKSSGAATVPAPARPAARKMFLRSRSGAHAK